MASVSETEAGKACDRDALLRKFLELSCSHDDQGTCDGITMLARLLRPDVKEFLALYDLSLSTSLSVAGCLRSVGYDMPRVFAHAVY